MAVPLQKVAAAMKLKHPNRKVDAVIVHESPAGGIRTPAVAPGVRATAWADWLTEN